MKVFILLILPILLSSCATTMPGSKTKTGSANVSATVDTNPVFTDKQIKMYQYSFKNETNQWIEFDGASMNGPASVSVLVGERISSWIEACKLEKSVTDYNTSMILGAVALSGAAVAGASGHSQTSSAGAIVALGSISAIGVRDFQNSKNRIEFQNAFPHSHIFQSFSLPPKKVLQRWILVENPSGEAFELKMKSKSGDEIILKVEANKSEAPAPTKKFGF